MIVSHGRRHASSTGTGARRIRVKTRTGTGIDPDLLDTGWQNDR